MDKYDKLIKDIKDSWSYNNGYIENVRKEIIFRPITQVVCDFDNIAPNVVVEELSQIANKHNLLWYIGNHIFTNNLEFVYH